jgi:hypothetical protein
MSSDAADPTPRTAQGSQPERAKSPTTAGARTCAVVNEYWKVAV